MDRIAYKPLGNTIFNQDTDDDIDINSAELDHLNEDIEADGDEAKVSLTDPHESKCFNNFNDRPLSRSRWNLLVSFRNLRLLLYLVSILLMLIFTTQLLSTNTYSNSINRKDIDDGSPAAFQHSELRLGLEESPHGSQDRSTSGHQDVDGTKQEATNNPIDKIKEPVIINTNNYNSSSEVQEQDLPDDFALLHPGIAVYKDRESEKNHWWSISIRNQSMYIAISTYIRGRKLYGREESVTLTSQATIEFMHHTIELCKRWDGPISLAVFCPGPELRIAVTLIKFLRHCLPEPLSVCIRDKVTWHLAYNRQHGPNPSEIGHPSDLLDREHYPLFADQDLCPKLLGPEPVDLLIQFRDKLMQKNTLSLENYRQKIQLIYPINVLRNVARESAKTKHLLASDIELYPSINLVPMFIDFIKKHNLRNQHNYMERFIFTLPIFEVKKNVTVPKTKGELVQLFSKGDAIFFHKWVCDACQDFPNRFKWLQDVEQSGDSSDNELKLFEITQRDKNRDQWEPIFIGTQEDPKYDERLSWEGRRDKMGLMFEMCLKDYYLIILSNGFLVHAPGIKRMADKEDIRKRYSHMLYNNAIYDATMNKLRREFSSTSTMNKCLINKST